MFVCIMVNSIVKDKFGMMVVIINVFVMTFMVEFIDVLIGVYLILKLYIWGVYDSVSSCLVDYMFNVIERFVFIYFVNGRIIGY